MHIISPESAAHPTACTTLHGVLLLDEWILHTMCALTTTTREHFSLQLLYVVCTNYSTVANTEEYNILQPSVKFKSKRKNTSKIKLDFSRPWLEILSRVSGCLQYFPRAMPISRCKSNKTHCYYYYNAFMW